MDGRGKQDGERACKGARTRGRGEVGVGWMLLEALYASGASWLGERGGPYFSTTLPNFTRLTNPDCPSALTPLPYVDS